MFYLLIFFIAQIQAEVVFSSRKLDNNTSNSTFQCGPSCNWKVNNTVLFIYGTGQMTNFTATNQSSWNSYNNTIETITFLKETELKTETLKTAPIKGVTSIGNNAFKGFTKLKTINFIDTIQLIGEEAFKGCTSLQTVEIPSSVKTIQKGAFDGCTSLKGVVYNGTTNPCAANVTIFSVNVTVNVTTDFVGNEFCGIINDTESREKLMIMIIIILVIVVVLLMIVFVLVIWKNKKVRDEELNKEKTRLMDEENKNDENGDLKEEKKE